MRNRQDEAFEAADTKAEKAADELGALLHRLTDRLSETVAPQYAIERLIATLAATQPELFSLLISVVDQGPFLLADSPSLNRVSTNCQGQTLH
jgi:hypothetical protein